MTKPEDIQLYELRKFIRTLPEDSQVQVEAIARTLRNILTCDKHSAIAFALVGAEEAAKSP